VDRDKLIRSVLPGNANFEVKSKADLLALKISGERG
jgi:hypothetical protein